MSTYFGLITTFASCFTAGMIFIQYLIQLKINAAQSRVNQTQREVNAIMHARLENLERQLPTAGEEERPHVH